MKLSSKRNASNGQGNERGGGSRSWNSKRDCLRSIKKAVKCLKKARVADPNLNFALVALPSNGVLSAATSGIFNAWKTCTSKHGMTDTVRRLASAPKDFEQKKPSVNSFGNIFKASRRELHHTVFKLCFPPRQCIVLLPCLAMVII